VARETIGSVKSQKKKKWIFDATYAAIREKTEAKGRQEATSRTEGRGYKESSEWINSSSWKGRMCMELKTANSKGNSRKLFQIVKSMTRKFQPRLQAIHQQLAKICKSQTGYREDLYCDEEGKGIEKEYWEQEPPPLRSQVARAICQTASRKATGPDEVPAKLFNA